MLTKVYENKKNDIKVLTISFGAIEYENNFYKLSINLTKDGDRVRVERYDDYILIYHVLTNDLIYKHKLADGVGNVVPIVYKDDNKPTEEDELKSIYSGNDDVLKFLKGMREQKPRYIYGQCRRFLSMRKFYTEDKIAEAVKYCNAIGKCTMMELSSYIMYKHGEAKAKNIFISIYMKFKETANRIREELDGRK